MKRVHYEVRAPFKVDVVRCLTLARARQEAARYPAIPVHIVRVTVEDVPAVKPRAKRGGR